MSVSPLLPVEMVTEPAQLADAAQGMVGSPALSVDTESNGFHHYPEQLCLVQIATGQRVYIIDSILLRDLAPLQEILADGSVQKVIHGADYDIRSIDRHCGFRIRNLYDTSIAARFVGIAQFGLAALIKELLGVEVLKSKRLQRADWGRRPLSGEAIDYAASDVRHLLALRRILAQRVQALGRTAWVAEECARLENVRYAAASPEDMYLSVKGASTLDGRGLAILRSLYVFREAEARRRHRPPFFVMPDSALVHLSMHPDAVLSGVPGLGTTGLKRFGLGLQEALDLGIAAPPVRRPRARTMERISREQARRLRGLKAWRTSLGDSFALDPSLIWPVASLQRLARMPDTLDVELGCAEVRGWQRAEFGSSLRACLDSLP